MADVAYLIGPAPARDSYLNITSILDAARRSGAQAVHPGYGFLSENAEFAVACAAAGIVFIGPPPDAIRAMGSKSAAKALMEQASVPLVPGYHGANQDTAHLAGEAARIGYPVLIKASAGAAAARACASWMTRPASERPLALAKGEARSSFGDDVVLIERYLTRPRHIEIQVFADTHGNVVSLFERDCSIQRRHQKVVEEAPAPGMDPARRASMGEAACAAARAIGYVGAGTVEFIVEDGDFFFMEMNTRLQVEHPVTEMITGQDLVEWQLDVAAGAPLPLSQDQLRIDGHAIEVRVYAEDPDRDFMPAVGTLLHLQPPAESAHIRVDTGVRPGDVISIHYDPMIAKLIVWDRDRPAAVRRLIRALSDYEVVGVQTNLGLLRQIAAHPAFGARGTRYRLHRPARRGVVAGARAGSAAGVGGGRAGCVAAPGRGDGGRRSTKSRSVLPMEPDDGVADEWRRVSGPAAGGGRTRCMPSRAHPRTDGSVRLDLPGSSVEADGATIDGVHRLIPVVRDGDALTTILDGTNHRLTLVDPLAPALIDTAGGDRLMAPMPGRVIDVLVRPGAAVERGAVLLVLEAMKVQMRLVAPRAGIVEAVWAKPGDLVDDGAELISFAPAK